MKKGKDSEFEIKFWKEWLYGDSLERIRLVEKLPITKEIENFSKLPKKIRKQVFAQMLNGFFEDLESAFYTKSRLEKNKKVS